MTTPGADPQRLCGVCGRELPRNARRGRPPLYCSEACRARARREQNRQAQCQYRDHHHERVLAQQRAYSYLYRHGLSRRQLLSGPTALAFLSLLETWPSGHTDQHEYAWHQFERLKGVFLTAKQSLPLIQDETHAVRLLLESTQLNAPEAARIWTYCQELLRDIGVHGDSEPSIQTVQEAAFQVERYWAMQGEYLHLVRAMLSHATLFQVTLSHNPDANFRAARSRLRGAEAVLEGLCRKADPEAVAHLRHQIVGSELRLIHQVTETLDAAVLDKLRELAKDIQSPLTWLDTLLQEVACLLPHEPSHAEERLAEAKQWASKVPQLTPLLQLSLAKREIDLLFESHRREQAQRKLHDFRTLLETHPNVYFLHHLARWIRKYHLAPHWQHVTAPVYTTPIISYLYLEPTLAKLINI